MNGIDTVALAALLTKTERNLDQSQHDPSTMGALVTVQADRSGWRSLLDATRDKLARR